MKKIAILLAVMALAGCSNGYSDANYPVLPPELSDCKFFNLTNTGGSNITVARCPNSTTTTISGGKHKKKVVVIDGIEYESKQEVKEMDNLKPQDLIPQ